LKSREANGNQDGQLSGSILTQSGLSPKAVIIRGMQLSAQTWGNQRAPNITELKMIEGDLDKNRHCIRGVEIRNGIVTKVERVHSATACEITEERSFE
jgi:hypothetical protein